MTSAQGDARKIDVDVACHSKSSTCSLNPVDYLPNEILWKLSGFLSVEDLCHLAVCSKPWRNVTNTNSLWLRLCKLRDWERFGKEVDLRNEKPIHYTDTITCGTSVTFQADSLIAGDSLELEPTCNWKEVYMRAWHLDKNWSEGRYQEHRVALADFMDNLVTIWPLRIGGSNAATGCVASDGRTFGVVGEYVQLWDLNNGRLLQKIDPSQYSQPLCDGSKLTISKIVLKNNTGLAAYKGGILVFEASTGNVLKLIRGTTSDFDKYQPSDIYLEDGKIIASYTIRCASYAGLFRSAPVHIWDISGLVEGGDDVACTETLLWTDSLNVSMRFLACHGHLVITSFGIEDETSFILWDTRAHQHARVYRGHLGSIYCGHLDENTIMTGYNTGEIKVWTTESDVCMKTLSTNREKVGGVLFNDNGIIAAYTRGVCCRTTIDLCFWSRDGSRKLNECELPIQMEDFRNLKMHGNRLVTLDKRINQVSVWELSTGKCLSKVHDTSGYRPREIVHVDDTKIVLQCESGRNLVILKYL